MRLKTNLILIWLVLVFAAFSQPLPSSTPIPPTPAHAKDPPHIWQWWATHIRGFRVDESSRWEPKRIILDANRKPIPQMSPIPGPKAHMPDWNPSATPSPLPIPPAATPGLP